MNSQNREPRAPSTARRRRVSPVCGASTRASARTTSGASACRRARRRRSSFRGADSYDESFTGWTAGAGPEQPLGGDASLRGELHYSGYGRTDRVTPYDDLAIQVPIALKASGVRFQVSLLWYF